MNNREEDTDTDPDGRDGVLRHLKGQFQSYSRLGDRRSDGSHITNGQSDKWLKQVREAFIKKNHFLIDPLIIDEKPLRIGGPVRGVTPPFIKVKNNIV